MRYTRYIGIVAAAAILMAPVAALAHNSESESTVVLTPTESGGAFEVSLDVVGTSLGLTFLLSPEGEVSVIGISGLPEGAFAEIDGNEVEVLLADGTEAEIELEDTTFDEQGNLTSVEAEVETEFDEDEDEDEDDEDEDDDEDDDEDEEDDDDEDEDDDD